MKDNAYELLKDVVNYYEGNEPYNLNHLVDDEERTNAALDAWEGIYGKIKAFLKESQRNLVVENVLMKDPGNGRMVVLKTIVEGNRQWVDPCGHYEDNGEECWVTT
jgi:hypothetical protein